MKTENSVVILVWKKKFSTPAYQEKMVKKTNITTGGRTRSCNTHMYLSQDRSALEHGFERIQVVHQQFLCLPEEKSKVFRER